ncbi:hypothetical protein [Pedobacter sp. SL55]|uniref:hypothetical protein n=1 Tax=Pedobacter sp. SL55 TaxID=2995161 RepID=UPI002270DF8F|nr:hypothetical protein [Pedobacter sp. SL55]WAC40392.1 hypothetical protein OVA16_17755 [Pedobacter sp. SL55]
MKKILTNIIILLLLLGTSCKKEVKTELEMVPLAPQMGALPFKYTSINVTPAKATKAASADFQQRWNTAKSELSKIGGRSLERFFIKYVDETTLSITFYYLTTGGDLTAATFKYNYTLNAERAFKLALIGSDENAKTIKNSLSSLTTDYLEKYEFKPTWIEDKIKGSYELLGAFYRTDDTASYFYGLVGVLDQANDTSDDAPLYTQIGVSKKFQSIEITPETTLDLQSSDFKARWLLAKERLLLNGGRQLKSYAINIISGTQLTIVVTYLTSAGATVSGTFTYNYQFSDRGYLTLSLFSKNANANAIEPSLVSVLDEYIHAHPFRIDWFDNVIPGSKGNIAVLYNNNDPTSYFYGNLIAIPLYTEIGFGKKYTTLTVLPETDNAALSSDFLTRWNLAKNTLYNNGGSRQLRSFAMRFTSASQLTLTFTYLTSTGSNTTGVFNYTYTISNQGLLKLTFVILTPMVVLWLLI